MVAECSEIALCLMRNALLLKQYYGKNEIAF